MGAKKGKKKKVTRAAVSTPIAPDLTGKRIELLTTFSAALSRWSKREYRPDREQLFANTFSLHRPPGAATEAVDPTEPTEASDRTFINRNMFAVRAALHQVRVHTQIRVAPPPAIGGLVMNVDPLSGNLFADFHGVSLIPLVVQSIEQAIGIYEHLRDGTGLVEIASREAIDLLGAIERSLRRFFGSKPPRSEKQVQDAIEVVLNSLAIRYSRDKETAAVGPRGFRPDFSLTNEETALEVKLAKPGHGASKVQEEITADIAGYSTRWKRLIVVVYDVGAIANPRELERENMKHFNVTVLVVKH